MCECIWRKSGSNSGGTQDGSRRLLEVSCGEGVPLPTEEGVCEGGYAVLFVPVIARQMLNFPPDVVIWWALKMSFLEIVNTLLELWG